MTGRSCLMSNICVRVSKFSVWRTKEPATSAYDIAVNDECVKQLSMSRYKQHNTTVCFG